MAVKKLFLICALLFLSAGKVFASDIPSNFSFTEDLELGDKGEEVKYLQIFLNNYTDFKVATVGVGSPGNETEYFGVLTEKAIINFQEKYFDDILAPWGFSKGTGMVSTTTRAKMNEIISNQSLSSDKISISSLYPYEGDTLVIKFFNAEENEIVFADFLGKTYLLYSFADGVDMCIIPISAKTTPGNYSILFYSNLGFSASENISVLDSNFPTTNLSVTSELEEDGYSVETIQENTLAENQLLYSEVLEDPITTFYFNGDFIYPLDSIKNVGAYGNIRCSGDVCLQHLGVDLDADEGTSVYSINNGIVKFARETTDYGKMIVVEHGGGIRSMYLHLSQFLVYEGQSVSKGQTIAYSGNTGYSIAPHLHLSVNVYGYSIDPLEFIETVNDEL